MKRKKTQPILQVTAPVRNSAKSSVSGIDAFLVLCTASVGSLFI